MSAISSKNWPLAPKDRSWDVDAAEMRVRKWAGGPDKEKVNWAKYRTCFLWYDDNDPENFGSYKFLYVDVLEGGPHVVFRSLVATIAILNGGRGGTKIPASDKKKVYNEAAKQYRRFDEEPPEYKGGCYRFSSVATGRRAEGALTDGRRCHSRTYVRVEDGNLASGGNWLERKEECAGYALRPRCRRGSAYRNGILCREVDAFYRAFLVDGGGNSEDCCR